MNRVLKICRIIGGMVLAIAAALLVGRCLNGNWNTIALQTLLPVVVASLLGALALRFVGSNKPAPSEIVPEYFHSALDGLKEGIVILDYSGHIAFSNQAFLELSGYSREELSHQRAKDLPWKWLDAEGEKTAPQGTHWLEVVKEGRSRCGKLIGLTSGTNRVFIMNSLPIAGKEERPLGAMISFEDVTKLQKKQAELASMLETVRQSAQQIRRQNTDLEQLVVRDQLTGCFHRRYGMELLEKLWTEARRDHTDLVCAMVDVDHFRAINEEHGHQAADKALQEVGMCLLRHVREHDVVCRYGGEEFLIVMPEITLEEAVRLAETLRQQVGRLQVGEVTLTISLGVAAMSQALESPQALLARADGCLSRAKERGRNQVCKQESVEAPAISALPTPRAHSDVSSIIPYPAVTALISALAYRDIATASHSRRVADLCVAMGQRLMSMSGCYVLEMSALLHDIGKIGVPDSTLLKATPLTKEEWAVMHAHDKIGVEIVRTAFATPELTEIVESYTRAYDESLRTEKALPLGARILAVADAYDSMTSDRIYRSAVSPAEALAELRRCAGSQFDPEIVSQFAEILFLQGSELSPRMEVDLDAALAFGLELERLAEAVDQQDIEMLKAIAGHLCRTADKSGAHEISAKAMELEQAAITGTDQLGVLQCANELLNYCRATQGAYVNASIAATKLAQQPVPLLERMPQLV